MQNIHIEFDLFAENCTAKNLFESSEVNLKDNIMDALNAYYISETIENFKMYKVEKEL